MKRLQIAIGAAILAAVLTSCSSGPSDDSVANGVKAKLFADAAAKQANIDVAVKDGVVTLTGNAPNSDAALAAVNDANSVSGVKRVDNQIAVGGQLPSAGNNTAQANPYPPPSSAPMNDHDHDRDHDRDRDHHDQGPPPPVAMTIPHGTRLDVRTGDTIASSSAQAGQTYRGSLAAPVTVDGHEVLPRGVPVTLTLVSADSAGNIKGRSELQLRVTSIEIHGQPYQIATSDITEMGNSRGKQTAERTGIGAAAGAVIGAIAGHGKGAAIGSLAGAGAGFGFQAFTHGKQVDIPAETILSFTLERPLTLQ